MLMSKAFMHRSKESGPKEHGFGLPKGSGSRYRAQGKYNRKENTLSLCLAPYTLYPKALLPAKPLNSDLAPGTRFSILNKYSSIQFAILAVALSR